jgi:hypothetical protein
VDTIRCILGDLKKIRFRVKAGRRTPVALNCAAPARSATKRKWHTTVRRCWTIPTTRPTSRSNPTDEERQMNKNIDQIIQLLDGAQKDLDSIPKPDMDVLEFEKTPIGSAMDKISDALLLLADDEEEE